MTEVMTMSAPAGVNLSTYTYTSAPRIVQNSRKSANRGNGNPMYDRRVVRGSNYAKRLGNEDLPKWNPYFTNARSLENIKPETEANQRRLEFREKLEARARLRRESHGLSSLYPSHASHVRPRAHSHAYVQTENYYEPLERPPEAEVGMQTEAWGEDGFPPPVVFQSPAVSDMATQVFEDELYDEDEGEVAVAALVARTVREATLEVLEEEQAEEERLSRMREALLHKVVSVGEEQQGNNSIDNEREGEVEGQEDEEDEERKDPDGKETSPLDTQEPARSPELAEDLVKGVTLLNGQGKADTPLPDAVQHSCLCLSERFSTPPGLLQVLRCECVQCYGVICALPAAVTAVIMQMVNRSIAVAVVVVSVLAVTTTGHMMSLGSCRNYPGMADFDPVRFNGTWYVIRKVTTRSNCLSVDYNLMEDGQSFRVEEMRRPPYADVIPIDLAVTNAGMLSRMSTPSKYSVTWYTGIIPMTGTYTMIDTDYDTYAVDYECQGVLGFIRRVSATILSRTPQLDEEKVEELVRCTPNSSSSSSSHHAGE